MKETIISQAIPINEKVGLYEELLEKGISLQVKATGRSMSPYLKGGETLTIQKVQPESLKKGDLIFFKDQTGFPVLHRIVRIQRKEKGQYIFQTKGDGTHTFDDPILEDALIGKVYKIESKTSLNGSKTIDMESFSSRVRNYYQAIYSIVRPKLSSLKRKIIPS
jgi:signal peptidase I